MKDKKVYHGFKISNNYSSVEHKRFYPTFEKAVEALVIHSISFNREPWGGFSEGKVFSTDELSITPVVYIKHKNRNIVLETHERVYHWHHEWRKPRIDKYNIHEDFKNRYWKRWKWCLDNVEDKNGVKKKDRKMK